MEKEPGPDVIKATQQSLGKYVKRPPLSDKLLKKPPFRFLHDIVTSVIKSTKFFEGLFEDDELISDNVKDRDSKILFLNKVITVLAITTGKNLSVKPSKIVAGQEPEKTNELLQCIAYALDKKLSSNEAVKKYKENTKAPSTVEVKTKDKEPKTTKNTNDTKKLQARSSEKLTTKKEPAASNKNEKPKTNEVKPKRKEEKSKNVEGKKSQNLNAVGKKSSVESNSQISLIDTKQVKDNQETDVKQKEITPDSDNVVQKVEIKSDEEVISTKKPSVETLESKPLENNKDYQEKLKIPNVENELNSSLSSQHLMDVENKTIDKSFENKNEIIETKPLPNSESKGDTLKSKEVDEPKIALKSSKPRPALIPKHESTDSEGGKETEKSVQDNVNISKQISEVIRPPSVRPSSSRPGAPRLREKIDNIVPENDNLLLGKVNIIAENTQNEEEEDTSVIIVEQHGLSDNDLADQQEVMLSSNEHGHLVQQILNSQKELSNVAGKTEIEWQFGAQKAKEASSQEIEQLRFNIQALSRVANPLGKLLDHIQEDVEVMRQELQQWTKVYEDVSKDMLKEKSATEETLVPLQSRVKQLDVDIVEKRDKINDIKILIHKNTTRIDKLLANGNVQ